MLSTDPPVRKFKRTFSHYTGPTTGYPVTNHVHANMVYLLSRVCIVRKNVSVNATRLY